MQRLVILFFFMICLSGQIYPQTDLYLHPPVTFINEYPDIDGVIDSQLTRLPQRHFNSSVLKTNAENPENPMNYRLGYGTDFLYIHIEVEADSIIRQEDGYRNGDGFMLSLT
ncbi:hypothetical protein GF337_12540, partial [candidate division KSB1 bacterium]|nr:hypothetical protein [candidate division KSB1 bacterium]